MDGCSLPPKDFDDDGSSDNYISYNASTNSLVSGKIGSQYTQYDPNSI